ILLNNKEFYTTSKINEDGVEQLIEWLTDNYDKYEPTNTAARDMANGINRNAMGLNDSLKRKKGQAKRTTELSRKHGISDIVGYLRNGGNIKDLI
ncbi:MAG: hypothetical protein HUJ61_03035, partial [Bacilli bacterium]|nr:hypothetical protein [Bacilli bacterium]